jgi:hypothetical protein
MTIDERLAELMIERISEIESDIRKIYIYFQEHTPISADRDHADYNLLCHKVNLGLFASGSQLDLVKRHLKGE